VWDRPAYSQVTRRVGTGKAARQIMGYSVRTERWRYTEWDNGTLGRELYDHANDPHETQNLADDPSHEPVFTEQRALLDRVR